MKKPELGVEAGQKTARNTPALKQEDLMEKKKAITAKNRAKQKDKRKKVSRCTRKRNGCDDNNCKLCSKDVMCLFVWACV